MTFRNLKVGTKMSLGFGGILLLLLAMMVSTFGALVTVDRSIFQVTQKNLPYTLKAERMEINVTKVQGLLTDAALTHDLLGSAMEGKDHFDEFIQGTESFKAIYLEQGDEAMVRQMEQMAADMNELYTTGRHMMLAYANEGKEAGDLIMTDFRKSSGMLVEGIKNFRNQQVEAIHLAGGAIQQASTQVKGLQIVLGAIALAVGIIITIMITRAITLPFGKAVSAAQRLAVGDMTVQLEQTSTDETGELICALNAMAGSLATMIGRIEVSTGHLSQVSVDIHSVAKRVVEVARTQSGNVDQTSSAITQIDCSIRHVGQGVDHLSEAAAENTSSILEMAASIEEVAQNMEALKAAVEAVSSAIVEMTASIRQVAANAGGLQDSATVTASSVSQMDMSIRQVEQSATTTADIAEQVRGDAEKGKAAVEATIAGMQEIRQASELSTDVIKTLSLRAENVGSILLVIDDVVNEINLLALNAAIIAAQAGAHGRGFSVVAEEIKELAERTGASTKEIAMVIAEVQEESRRAVDTIATAGRSVAEGVQLSQQSGVALAKIVEGARQTSQQMAEIVRATREQADGSRMIQQAMQEVTDMTRQIAMATLEQEKGGEQILAAAEQMKQRSVQVQISTRQQSQASTSIARATEEMAAMIVKIKQACDEQTKGSEQIVRAVENINDSTAMNLDAAEVMDSAVARLGEQIGLLHQEMSAFKVREGEEQLLPG